MISRTDGAVTVTFPASAGGETNHAALINLDYASAGHTGFQPTIAGTPVTNGANISVLVNDSAYITDADIAGNSTVASNTAKVSYSDLGNVALLDTANTFAGIQYADWLYALLDTSTLRIGNPKDTGPSFAIYGTNNGVTSALVLLDDISEFRINGKGTVEYTATNGTEIVNYQTATNLIATLSPPSSGGGSITSKTDMVDWRTADLIGPSVADSYDITNATEGVAYRFCGFDKGEREYFDHSYFWTPLNWNSNVIVNQRYFTGGSTNLTAAFFIEYRYGGTTYAVTNVTLIPASDLTNQATWTATINLPNAVAGEPIWWTTGVASTNDAASTRDGTIYSRSAECSFLAE